MKIAIVHFWLVNMRGGEQVLKALCELYPDADIYTHVYDPSKIDPVITRHRIFTTSVSKLPFATKFYTKYLTFMPKALENLDLSSYDLVISSESGPAKGIITPSHIPHLCYCHSPMRYLWDYYHQYLQESGPLTRFFFKLTAKNLRLWDLATSYRVDQFLANSAFIKQRIRHVYRRDAQVVYPPINIEDFNPQPKEGYYLFLGQLVGYKRADLAIEAFKQNGKPLIIIGGGKKPRNLPSNIKVMGHLPLKEKNDYLAQAKALIFPGEEDFGIVPVEAIASGTPVLAYGRGGALETVKEGISGFFFHEQTADAINDTIKRFEEEQHLFTYEAMKNSVKQFSREAFKEAITKAVQQLSTSS